MPTLGTSGPGHNAWQMASAALVLFMTLPGLALFYGGLVRRKNVLSVCAQCFFITGLVTILWWLCGYSLVFGKGNMFFGLYGSWDKRSEEHTSELQSHSDLVCRLLLEKKKKKKQQKRREQK